MEKKFTMSLQNANKLVNEVVGRRAKQVARHRTSTRLAMIREQALRALEAEYKDLPGEVHEKIKTAIDAILDAETAVIKWQP